MGILEGKVAFISGAARGQGRSHALRLAEEGADIIAVDICKDLPTVPYPGATPEDLEDTVKGVEALDRRILAFQSDVRDPDAMREAVNAGVAEFGHVDIVCANAGILTLVPASEMTDVGWDETIAINLSGVWNTVSAALPHLISQGTGGSIIITSSLAGTKGLVNACHYAAAKHGVVGLARALANELGPLNIRVNTIHPTSVATPMVMNKPTYRFFRPDLEDPELEDTTELFSAMNSLPVPLVEASDISNAVLWLASDQARYVTGIALPIDAGAAQK